MDSSKLISGKNYMECDKTIKDQVVLIKILEKRIDMDKSPDFKKELLSWLVHDSPNLVIDLAQVDYMDSSGLGALLFGIRQAKRFHGNLVVTNLCSKVKKLLEIAHLTKTIIIFKSESEALKYFAQAKNNGLERT